MSKSKVRRSICGVYVKYDPKNNLPTHEANLPNQREKEDKALTNDVCVTNEANQNLTTIKGTRQIGRAFP